MKENWKREINKQMGNYYKKWGNWVVDRKNSGRDLHAIWDSG